MSVAPLDALRLAFEEYQDWRQEPYIYPAGAGNQRAEDLYQAVRGFLEARPEECSDKEAWAQFKAEQRQLFPNGQGPVLGRSAFMAGRKSAGAELAVRALEAAAQELDEMVSAAGNGLRDTIARRLRVRADAARGAR